MTGWCPADYENGFPFDLLRHARRLYPVSVFYVGDQKSHRNF